MAERTPARPMTPDEFAAARASDWRIPACREAYARYLCDFAEVDADDLLLHHELARTLFERAQDGYVNPTGGKTTGRERKDA